MLIIEPMESFQSKAVLYFHIPALTQQACYGVAVETQNSSLTLSLKRRSLGPLPALTPPRELSLASEITSFSQALPLYACHHAHAGGQDTSVWATTVHKRTPLYFRGEFYSLWQSPPPQSVQSPPQTSFSDIFLFLKLALKSLSSGGFGWGYHSSITRLIALNAGRGCQPGEVPGSLPEPLHSILFVTPIKHVGHQRSSSGSVEAIHVQSNLMAWRRQSQNFIAHWCSMSSI